MKKTRNWEIFTVTILLLLLAFTSIAFADQPIPAVPETQGLVTSTGADVVGMASETDAGVWTLTNDPSGLLLTNSEPLIFMYPSDVSQLLAAGGYVVLSATGHPTVIFVPPSLLNQDLASKGIGPLDTWAELVNDLVTNRGYTNTIKGGIHTGTLDPGQVQYTTAYDASILGQAGHTVLAKSMNINTGNKVAATQSNLNANTLLTYVATGDGGNVAGSENLLIDGAGNFTPASDRMLCPFVGGNDTIIPAYCNIVQAGSSFDLTVGSVTTAANDRFVGTDATVPIALNYDINVKPYGTTSGSIPAMGSVSAYIKAHIQESRGETAYNNTLINLGDGNSDQANYLTYGAPTKAEDLQYSEVTSASGIISTFSKSMKYSSQATSTKLNVVPGVTTFIEFDGG